MAFSDSLKVLGVIPARYASSRFPGKPLADIFGKTMIRRVYEQALQCTLLSSLTVATDHDGIYDHVNGFGGKAMMTAGFHTSGTERCCEVLARLSESGEQYDYVVNIQGDEPFLDPGQIESLIKGMASGSPPIGTLIKKISDVGELFDPNVVKVVTDRSGYALTFSRAAIPHVRGAEPSGWMSLASFFKHIGIYGYRAGVLREIVNLPPSALEKAESLEQLRWIENGYRVQTYLTEKESVSIDVPSDLLKITNTARPV